VKKMRRNTDRSIKGKTMKNPVTGKTYPIVERKTSEATQENIKTLWKPSKTKTGKKYW
jgi:hypothetical protein